MYRESKCFIPEFDASDLLLTYDYLIKSLSKISITQNTINEVKCKFL